MDDHVALRYLLVLPGGSTNNNSALCSTKVKFQEHYSNYIKKLKLVNDAEKQLRIKVAIEKFKERKLQEEKQRKILEKEMKKKLEEDDE